MLKTYEIVPRAFEFYKYSFAIDDHIDIGSTMFMAIQVSFGLRLKSALRAHDSNCDYHT